MRTKTRYRHRSPCPNLNCVQRLWGLRACFFICWLLFPVSRLGGKSLFLQLLQLLLKSVRHYPISHSLWFLPAQAVAGTGGGSQLGGSRRPGHHPVLSLGRLQLVVLFLVAVEILHSDMDIGLSLGRQKEAEGKLPQAAGEDGLFHGLSPLTIVWILHPGDCGVEG